MTRQSLASIKSSVTAGQVYDLTNHYVERTGQIDHPYYGTRRVTVSAVNTSAFRYTEESGGHGRIPWPKAGQIERGDDGVIRMYGLGANQRPADLFITLVPVSGVPVQNSMDLTPRTSRQTNAASELAERLTALRRSESLTYRPLIAFEPGQFDVGRLVGDDVQIPLDTYAAVGRVPCAAGDSIAVNEYGGVEGAIVTATAFDTIEALQNAVRRWCRVHLGRDDVSFSSVGEA